MNYKQKYLKYKNKYLQLKKQLGGYKQNSEILIQPIKYEQSYHCQYPLY